MPVNEQYLTIRNRIRRLAYRDSLAVIWAYAQYLQRAAHQFPNDIEVHAQFLAADVPQGLIAEWTLEQLTREVVRHAGAVAEQGQTLRRWATLVDIVNGLRQLEQDIYAEFVGDGQIHLELMRISHRQFAWQQHPPNWRTTIRYYKLFNTEDIVPLCEATTGLRVHEIYVIGMAFLGVFLGRPRTLEQTDVQLPGIDQAQVERFVGMNSLTLAELSNRLRDEHELDGSFAYRYSSLREFPLVRIQHGGVREIACPIPTLLFWRMTFGLYYELKTVAGFPTAFGRSFERYVGEVLDGRITNPDMAVREQAEYWVGKQRKDTVDWIVQQGGQAALFVECKTKRLTWASKAGLTDLTALEQDIRKLAGGVVQIYRTIIEYRAGRYPNLPFLADRRIYPAVVTLEDWYFFGHELTDRLRAAVEAAIQNAGLPISWLDEMPYSVMSADEFEKVTGVVNTIGIAPFFDSKQQAEFRRWPFGSFCNDRYPEQVGALADLFHDEYDALFPEIDEGENGIV
jgi:hypothetical protein